MNPTGTVSFDREMQLICRNLEGNELGIKQSTVAQLLYSELLLLPVNDQIRS